LGLGASGFAMNESLNGESLRTQHEGELQKRESSVGFCLKVVADAVVGGGFDLRSGEILDLTQVGEYANALVTHGACELVPEQATGFVNLV